MKDRNIYELMKIQFEPSVPEFDILRVPNLSLGRINFIKYNGTHVEIHSHTLFYYTKYFI
jgi:hypothetical protein